MIKNNHIIKNEIKNRINIVLMREPYKYKEFIEKYKNVFFENNEIIYENIILFPFKYSDTQTVLNKFIKIIKINHNKYYNPICKTLWVADIKENYGCELFFDYELQDKFCEEKVFDNEKCTVYKYTKI
jgi:hypothetical protein